MKRTIDLRVIELVSAKLCHDLIGPIAAISNGAELLADEEPEFVGEAVALVGDSARKASKRLQFYRFAYGFGGGGLAGPPPHQLAAGFFEDGPIACDYGAEVQALPLAQQKLACALLALAGEALPRGGRLVVGVGADGLEIEAEGEGAAASPQIRAAMSLVAAPDELTSRTVGGYFAGLLAEALGCRLVVAEGPRGFRLAAIAA